MLFARFCEPGHSKSLADTKKMNTYVAPHTDYSIFRECLKLMIGDRTPVRDRVILSRAQGQYLAVRAFCKDRSSGDAWCSQTI
jgi:hypothetical protein